MIDINKFLLTPEEMVGGTWGKVRSFLENSLHDLRVKNDDHKLTPEQTATIRGHIACINSILSLARERASPRVTASGALSYPPRTTPMSKEPF